MTLTVKELYEYVEALPEDVNVTLCKWNPFLLSWRGDYTQLTLDCKVDESQGVPRNEFLETLRRAGEGITEFYGYKGGRFRMNWNTPVWADQEGSANGREVITVSSKGEIIITRRQSENSRIFR